MKTEHSMNGGLRLYVSILPALFPAIVLLSASMIPLSNQVHPAITETNPLVAKVRSIYTSQIGVREKHENSGPEVEQYLKYVSLPKGNPWCAAFVCWVYGKAGVGNPKSGWTPSLFKADKVIWDRKEQGTKSKEQRLPQSEVAAFYRDVELIRPAGQLVTGNWQPAKSQRQPTISNPKFLVPTTGDVFGLYFPEKRRIAHTGFIDQWDGTWLISVEGNTNVSGSREGDGVYRKRRLVRSVYKVARYIR